MAQHLRKGGRVLVELNWIRPRLMTELNGIFLRDGGI